MLGLHSSRISESGWAILFESPAFRSPSAALAAAYARPARSCPRCSKPGHILEHSMEGLR
jgi:hypothetical protein